MKKILFFFLAVLVILGLTYPFVLNGMARYLMVEDKLKPSDVIVVLGGDDNGERVDEAVKIFNADYGKKLLLSGGPLAWHLTGAEWMKKQAVFEGVPARRILLEDKSRSTLENARFCLPILQAIGAKRIVIVTSPTHCRRAKWVFSRVFNKTGIEIFCHPAPANNFKPNGWWTRHEDTQLVVWEYVSLVFYWLKGY